MASDAAPPSRGQTGGRGARRFAGFVAGFLIVVLGTEVAVRVVHDRLPAPRRYFSMPAETTVMAMDTLRANGVRSDLTFVGTSMVRRDIDANLLEKVMPGIPWAHNVALAGSQADVVKRWLLEEVEPRLRPKRVAWGVSSLDFNCGRTDHPIDQYDAARATEKGTYGDLDRVLWNSDISLYRDSLRDPYTLYTSARTKQPSLRDNRPLRLLATQRMAYPPRTDEQIAAFKGRHYKYARDVQLLKFHTCKQQLDAYRDVMRSMNKQKIPLAIVVMPVPTAYLKAHPNGARDYEAWKRQIESIAKAEHVSVIDMSTTMPDSAYRDTEHLEVEGARDFTRLLAPKLQALGW